MRVLRANVRGPFATILPLAFAALLRNLRYTGILGHTSSGRSTGGGQQHCPHRFEEELDGMSMALGRVPRSRKDPRL